MKKTDIFYEKRKIDWDWLVFRVGLAVIFIADMSLLVVVLYAYYLGLRSFII